MAKGTMGANGRKSSSAKRKPQKRRTNNKIKKHNSLKFIVLFGTIWILFLIGKDAIFSSITEGWVYKNAQDDPAGALIERAINLYLSTSMNPNNTPRWLELLNDPVVWYSENEKSHSQLKAGARKYDNFALINPLKHEVPADHRGGNYEVWFDGFYRFRVPKDSIVYFQSGLVTIEGGKISTLSPKDNPNAYKYKNINLIFKYYCVATLVASIFCSLMIIIILNLPRSMIQFLFQTIKKAIGL